MAKLTILKEFAIYLSQSKKWWLTPIVVSLVLIGALLVLSEGTAVAPFIYTLF